MNGMNKTISSVVSAIALVYAGLCFFLTLQNYVVGDHSIHIFIFAPMGLDNLGIDLTKALIDSLSMEKGLYETVLDTLLGYVPGLGGVAFYIKMVMILFGFILAAFGFMSKSINDCSGDTNPAQYLWTHRPRALLKCVLQPWGLIIGAWNKSKPLVILPILPIFMYLPWSIMISIYLIIPFLVSKMVISSKINTYAKKEEKEYKKNTEYGVCPHCKMAFDRPIVKCRCGLLLDYPVPNIYGYKYHTCNKGHDISCESGKRGNLTTLCPHCRKQIQTREALPITISFIGGTGTGKTSLMLAAVETITHNARIVDITVDSPSAGLSKDAIAAKDYAPRTVPGEQDSQVIFLRSLGLQDREIIFNDISGVEFQPSVNKVIFEEYYNYTNGFIFTFDPMSFNREVKREMPHDVFDCFHYIYTTIRNIGPGTVTDVPFAVVATKSDLVSPKLGDDDVRQFLIDNGEENFVRVVESLFTEVKYFSVCSHGSSCASAMKPVWWIVGHVDKKLTEIIPSP